MIHTYDMTAIDKLRSIETAEQYLIARTHAEINDTAGQSIAATVNRTVWAISLAATIVAVLQMGYIRGFLT